MTPFPAPTAALPPARPPAQFPKILKLATPRSRDSQGCTHILISREVRVAVLVAAQLLLLGSRHVCSRRRCRHFPLGHIPPPPSRFLPPRAGPPPHRRQASPAGACRKAAAGAATAAAAAPPTVANRAQPPRRACVRPRHTAEKGARARARPPARLPGAFPSPAPDGRSSRRPLGTWPGGVGGSEGRLPHVPLLRQRLGRRRNSKGCSLTPFPAKTFAPQLARSFDLRPAANERKSVARSRPPLSQKEGGGTRGSPPRLGRLCQRSLCRV